MKIAVYVWVLLSVFSSPGTLPTSTSIVTGVPIGGADVSGIEISAFVPALV